MQNLDISNEKNYYKLLGCDISSDTSQILSEFKNQALLFHPDKVEASGQDEANRKFQILVEARDVLIDEKLRKEYDLFINMNINISFQDFIRMHPHKAPSQSMHWAFEKKTPALLTEDTNVLSENKVCEGKNFKDLISKFRNYEI